MWLVDPEIMCRNHLLGEHKELHQLLGHIESGNLESVRGHAERGQVDTSLIVERHEELVEEMDRRGFNHESPVEYDDDLDVGEIEVEENLEELIDRCEKCRARYMETRD